VLAAAASSSDSNTEEVECTDWFDNFTPPTTASSRNILKTKATKLVSDRLESPPKKKDPE
jgi:hypothetical protein